MKFRAYRAVAACAAVLIVLSGASAAQIEWLDAYYRPDRMVPQFFPFWSTSYTVGDEPPVYSASGQLCAYLRNTSGSAVTISDVMLQGVSLKQAIGCNSRVTYQTGLCYACSLHYPSSTPITTQQRETLIAAGEPVWWRVVPSTVPAGGTAEVYVRMRSRVPGTLSLSVVPATGDPLQTAIQVSDSDIPRIARCAFSPDMSTLYLYLRHPTPGKAPVAILVDGSDVTARCTIGADPGVDIVVVVCSLPSAFTRGSFHCIQAVYDDGTRASAGLRAFYDDFRHGLWGGPNSTSYAEAADHLRSMANHSINVQVMQTGFGSLGDYLNTPEGYQLMTQLGIWRLVQDPSKAANRLWGLFLCDEPDVAEPSVPETICPAYARPGVMAQSLWYKADGFRVSNPSVPTVLNVDNSNRPYDWYHYGQLADIFSSDPYVTHRLRDAYWYRPHQQSLYSKMTYAYAWSCTSRAASEPRPYRCILNCSRIQTETRIWRFSTPEEHRIQAYYALAGGATQLDHWWFTPREATETGSAGCGTNEPAAAAIWREIGLLGAEFGTAGSVIVRSCPASFPITSTGTLWARALAAGLDTVALICVNDDYACDESGTVVRPIENASLSFALPSWITPAAVFEVDSRGVRDVGWSLSERRISVQLGRVDVTRFTIVTSDPALKPTLQSLYEAKYRPRIDAIAPAE